MSADRLREDGDNRKTEEGRKGRGISGGWSEYRRMMGEGKKKTLPKKSEGSAGSE